MQRYTQYTHKISVPMRKELYDFLNELPHGIKAQVCRTFLLKFREIVEDLQPKWKRKYMNDLINGHYQIATETDFDHPVWSETDED